MSRSIVLPLLALAAVVLYGTTMAGSPDEVRPPAVVDIPSAQAPAPAVAPIGPPPPAPRLRSELEADSAGSAVAAPDSSSAPLAEESDGEPGG